MSASESIKDYIILSDLFSNPIDFYYHNRKSYPTACGGCTSIVFFLILFIYMCYLLNLTIKGESSIIVEKRYFLNQSQQLFITKDVSYSFIDQRKYEIPDYLSNQTFYLYLSFGIQDNSRNLEFQKEDPSYFSLKIMEVTNKSNVIKYRPLDYFLCNKFGDFPAAFKLLNLSYTYCINDSFEISGAKGLDFSKVIISVSKCFNSSLSSIKCKTPKQIDDKIGNLKMTLYYSENLMNMTSFNPIISTLKNQYWDLNSSWKKNSMMKLAIKQLDSYDSFLPSFLNNNRNRYYSLGINGFYDSVRVVEDDKVFFNLEIVTGNELVIFERTFQDIFSQLSYVGGISSLVLNIGLVLVSYVASFRTDESLTNDIYHLISPEKTKFIKIPFEEFIKNHYHKLIKKNLKEIRKECEEELKLNSKEDEENEESVFSFSSSNNEKDLTKQNASEEKKILPKRKKRDFISKILKKLRARTLKRQGISVEENEEKIKENYDSEKKLINVPENQVENENKEEIKIQIQEERKDIEGKEEMTDVNQIKIDLKEKDHQEIEIKDKNSEKRSLNEHSSVNRGNDEKTNEKKAENIPNTNNIQEIELVKKADSNVLQRKDSENSEKSEEEEKKQKEITSIEKYITREKIEKIYGIEFENVKRDIKKIIKKNLKDINESKKKLSQLAGSENKKRSPIKKLKSIFKKSIKFDEDELEDEIEAIQKDYIKKVRVDEGVFEKIVSQYQKNEVEFMKYKFIYEMMKFVTNDKFRFKSFEIFQILCCSLCIKNKYNKYKIINSLQRNFKNKEFIKQEIKNEFGDSIDIYKKKNIFNIAKKKLLCDLDIVKVLKTIKQFERFIKVSLDRTQINLFKCLSKPQIEPEDESFVSIYKKRTIKGQIKSSSSALEKNSSNNRIDSKKDASQTIKENNDILEENIDENELDFKQICHLDKLMSRIIEKDELNFVDKKFFVNMGIDVEDIIRLNEFIRTNKHMNSTNLSHLDKNKDAFSQEMKQAYPNIIKMFGDAEKGEENKNID